MIDRKTLIGCAVAQVDKPYKFGSKWSASDLDPKGPVDCSGFVKWVYSQIKIDLPDGSTNQHLQATESTFVLPGDLVFLHTQLGINDEHHVGMIYDQYLVIEARGVIKDGQEIGTVCLHTLKEWKERPDFVGIFRPKAVIAIEGA
jgi:hypothetical protein